MWNTLSKLTPAKREFDDPSTDRIRSRAIFPKNGFFKEEIKVIFVMEGGR